MLFFFIYSIRRIRIRDYDADDVGQQWFWLGKALACNGASGVLVRRTNGFNFNAIFLLHCSKKKLFFALVVIIFRYRF